jgi:hypothetical protein
MHQRMDQLSEVVVDPEKACAMLEEIRKKHTPILDGEESSGYVENSM